jgi:demethylmenaquinone methyltransferase/2-methoxy-6-polyprenyl-1,4-benzoquinol methylase
MSSVEAQNPREGSGAMFDGIAERYDFVNRVISLGVDQRWRRATIAALELRPGERVLDLATGTGDLAIAAARAEPGARIVGLDPSQKMLEIGRAKLERLKLDERVELVFGDAEKLPFEAGSFDAACMAFGIRNVVDRPRALAEIARVTRAGGRVAILELSEPEGGALGALARFHVHTVVPRVGALLSGKREYVYLQRSIAAFPRAADFAEMMRAAGLVPCELRPLTFGVCHLYVAEREP